MVNPALQHNTEQSGIHHTVLIKPQEPFQYQGKHLFFFAIGQIVTGIFLLAKHFLTHHKLLGQSVQQIYHFSILSA